MADIIDSVFIILMNYWWVFVIAILAFILVGLYIKYQKLKKIQYYSQIEVNRELKFKELQYNPTDIKYIKYKGKKWVVYGELIRGWYRRQQQEIKQQARKIYTPEEIKNLEYEAIKIEAIGKKPPDYITHDFLVRKGNLLGMGIGEKAGILIKHEDFVRDKFNTITVNQGVTLVYYNGFYVNFDFDLMNVMADDAQRFMSDHRIDGSGYQMKDFSRIRSDWSHDEVMKDKEIDAEKEKDKGRRFGGRS